MKAKRSRPGKRPAQAMVEFALVLPILLLLIYGIIEVGRVLFIYSSVVTSARSAARYGATTGLNDASITLRYQDCAGMRAAARKSAFIDSLADDDINIAHDKGEGQDTAVYCSGVATDSSFTPSAGNTDRVRVTVSTEYSPIVPIVPIGPFTITSTAARTVLVSVPIQITAPPLGWNAPTNTPAWTPTFIPTETSVPTDTPTPIFSPTASNTPTITYTPTITPTSTKTGTPTNTGTPTFTPSPTGTPFVCDVKHSALKTNPSYSMTVFNDSADVTIHIASVTITFNSSPAENHVLNSLAFGGVTIWTGSQNGSPLVITSFVGDISVGPGASKLMTVGFSKNYKDNGAEQIVITFSEASCPPLDSNNPSQLKVD